jgi:hypothetical protein
MMLEYQVVYNLKSDLKLLQGCLNRMARDGWTLTYVNANALYAVFQRPTNEPCDNQVIDLLNRIA